MFDSGSVGLAITNSPAFQFNVDDITRIRLEMNTLLVNLEQQYAAFKSTQDEASTDSVAVAWRHGKEQPDYHVAQQQPSIKMADKHNVKESYTSQQQKAETKEGIF